MEPISALLVLAGSHGAMALVKSLSGADELGQLSGELVRALAASESRIDERLDRIESGLDELLEQSYSVAIHRGVRYLLDATGSTGDPRRQDLDRARDAFVEATAAARSPLQQAVAERYLLLVLLGLGRHDAVPASLVRVEEYATANAFDALRTSEHNHDATTALLRRGDGRPGWLGDGRPTWLGGSGGEDRLRQARTEVKRAALDSIDMSARLLAEMALVRPTLNLPAVSAPPVEPIVDDSIMTVRVKQTRYGVETVSQGEGHLVPYWTFEAAHGRPLRLGSLTVTVSSEPAPPGSVPHRRSDRFINMAHQDERVRGHLRVEARAPLPVAVAVASYPEAGATDFLNRSALDPGGTVAHAPLQWSDEAVSWVRITPQYVNRTLIEVVCRL